MYVNLYASSAARFDAGAAPLAIRVESEMPWGGKSSIVVTSRDAARRVVKLRVPGWAQDRPTPGGLYAYTRPLPSGVTVAINGRETAAAPDRHGYISMDREWREGDRIDIEFPFEVRQVTADERVREVRGRVAVERGPLVYCVEAADNPGPVHELSIPAVSHLDVEQRADLLDGVMAVKGTAYQPRTKGDWLYTPVDDVGRVVLEPVQLTAIPFYANANRGPVEMVTWLRVLT